MATRRKAKNKSELSSAVKFFAALIIVLGFLYLYSGTSQTAQFYEPKAAEVATQAAPTALPDLIVKDITFSSANAKVSDTIQTSITFCNLGDGDAEAFSFGVIDLSENNGFGGSLTGLLAGECRAMQGFWQLKAAGLHTIKATADDSNLVTESDETNNVLEKSLNVL
jgi:subtilase family serine protease